MTNCFTCHNTHVSNTYGVNTALAFMNRNMFPAPTNADKAAIDSLKDALNKFFLSVASPEVIAASNDFGNTVTTAVFNWSETDGSKYASDPYTPLVGPAYRSRHLQLLHLQPYILGNNPPIIAGSIFNTQPAPPIAYSEYPKSSFIKW